MRLDTLFRFHLHLYVKLTKQCLFPFSRECGHMGNWRRRLVAFKWIDFECRSNLPFRINYTCILKFSRSEYSHYDVVHALALDSMNAWLLGTISFDFLSSQIQTDTDTDTASLSEYRFQWKSKHVWLIIVKIQRNAKLFLLTFIDVYVCSRVRNEFDFWFWCVGFFV